MILIEFRIKILNLSAIPLIVFLLAVNVSCSAEYGTFQGVGLTCHPLYPTQYPKTLANIKSLVLKAIALNTTIKAFGSKHSLTDIICTDGIPLSMKNINHIWINGDNTVTCGAGAELLDVLDTLHLADKTLLHVPAYGGITIGGAIGAGSHGSSLKHPTSISDQVVSMVIIDGLGKIRTIADPEELKAFRVHLGLLGILYEVTLKTVPLFKLQITNYPLPESVLFGREILNRAESFDWFQMWWFPGSKCIVISEGTIVPTNVSGHAKTNLITDMGPLLSAFSSVILEGAAESDNIRLLWMFEEYTKSSLLRRVPGKNPIFTEDGATVVNPAVGYGYEMMCGKCVQCAWDEYFFVEESSIALNLDEFPLAFETIRRILSEAPAAFNMFGLFIRFSPPSDTLLALQGGRRTFHIDWVSPLRFDYLRRPKHGLGTMQAIMQAMVTKHGARPHWAKNGLYYLTEKVLNKAYGKQISRFVEYMNKSDPMGIFRNDFSRRILGLDKKVKTFQKHCALQDNCICETDEDCGPGMQCAYLSDYRVCKRHKV